MKRRNLNIYTSCGAGGYSISLIRDPLNPPISILPCLSSVSRPDLNALALALSPPELYSDFIASRISKVNATRPSRASCTVIMIACMTISALFVFFLDRFIAASSYCSSSSYLHLSIVTCSILGILSVVNFTKQVTKVKSTVKVNYCLGTSKNGSCCENTAKHKVLSVRSQNLFNGSLREFFAKQLFLQFVRSPLFCVL